MMNHNFINKTVRIFSIQTKDPGMICKPDLSVGYLVSLLVDKIGMDLFNITSEILYPFKKYADFLLKNLSNFQEDYYIFFLENYYHSSNYWLGYLKQVLNKMKENWQNNKVIIHSFKLWQDEARELMDNYNFIDVIIRTDVEYFFNEFLYKKTPINEIANILYRDSDNKIIINKTEEVAHDLWDYIVWWYYNWYIFRLMPNENYIATMIDEDDVNTDDKIYYSMSKTKYLNAFKEKQDVLISTWRWCKYKCVYCYRWVKYSTVRQIPLDVLKKDLDYLESIWIDSINMYDDCFLTTNRDRLKEIVDLLWNYNMSYRIAVRYEMCTPETFNILKWLKLNAVQIWLQSTSKETNTRIRRNINDESFQKIIAEFKGRWVGISIDTIIWLPWETYDDFMRTYKYVLALKPNRIAINTLFINPWIAISVKELKEKYGIKIAKRKDYITDFYKVSAISENSTFPKVDIKKAKEYIKKSMDYFPEIKIVLR